MVTNPMVIVIMEMMLAIMSLRFSLKLRSILKRILCKLSPMQLQSFLVLLSVVLLHVLERPAREWLKSALMSFLSARRSTRTGPVPNIAQPGMALEPTYVTMRTK